MVTHGGDHPYVGNWWPDRALSAGTSTVFINQLADMLNAQAQGAGGCRAYFEDAYKRNKARAGSSVPRNVECEDRGNE